MNHLAQVGSSPRAVLLLIRQLGWETGWGSPDREMALLWSGRRGTARTPLLPAQDHLPRMVLGKGTGLYSWGWKVLDPPACFASSAGLFFPGNINYGVQNERCGWNLLWHRLFPGKSALSGLGGVQSEASTSPEVFNFSAKSVVYKRHSWFQSGRCSHSVDSPWM